VANDIIAHAVPSLRRYARALAGSQSSGDAYVAATLEALAADRALLDDAATAADVRVALYRIFTIIWNSANSGRDGEPAPALPGDRNLALITPLPRQAFLLMALERLPEESAARVLGIGSERLRELVDAAGREMAAALATDVLIIEDEPLIAMDLEMLLGELGHTVTGIARTHAQAVKMATERPPGLILADIKLADDSSGLDAVNELLQRFAVPVIFITAYPERYLTGERPEPTFLIPKPFDPAMVSAVISQALFFERNARPTTEMPRGRANSAGARPG
jgi:CheY-like chemotaxis protein